MLSRTEARDVQRLRPMDNTRPPHPLKQRPRTAPYDDQNADILQLGCCGSERGFPLFKVIQEALNCLAGSRLSYSSNRSHLVSQCHLCLRHTVVSAHRPSRTPQMCVAMGLPGCYLHWDDMGPSQAHQAHHRALSPGGPLNDFTAAEKGRSFPSSHPVAENRGIIHDFPSFHTPRPTHWQMLPTRPS